MAVQTGEVGHSVESGITAAAEGNWRRLGQRVEVLGCQKVGRVGNWPSSDLEWERVSFLSQTQIWEKSFDYRSKFSPTQPCSRLDPCTISWHQMKTGLSSLTGESGVNSPDRFLFHTPFCFGIMMLKLSFSDHITVQTRPGVRSPAAVLFLPDLGSLCVVCLVVQ